MRRYNKDNKRALSAFFLLVFTAVFLSPTIHAHDFRHATDDIHYYDFELNVPANHDHTHHHFPLHGAFIDFPAHDHDCDLHFHYIEDLTVRVKRGVSSPEKNQFFVLHTESRPPSLNQIFHKIQHSSLYIVPPKFKYTFNTADLPPPIA